MRNITNFLVENFEEVLTPQDLKKLLASKAPLHHYIGFEISGLIHLGTGLACMQKVALLQKLGINCSIFLADWHSWINNKLGGNKEKIRQMALGYFKEGMIASLKCVGGNPDRIKFVLGSDLYHHNDRYWATIVEISKNITLARNLRSLDIMGRQAKNQVDFARLLYPPMQVADIFIQNINLAHAGTDQRKAHVIARQVANKLTVSPLRNKIRSLVKPVAIHHHLILGLNKPPVWPIPKNKRRELYLELKMSKSKPETCVFIHDTPEKIRGKIKKAFCPPDNTEFNSILDWINHLILPIAGKIRLAPKHGKVIEFDNFAKLKSKFLRGEIHPADLKEAVAKTLIKVLEPARNHFSQSEPQKALEEMKKLSK